MVTQYSGPTPVKRIAPNFFYLHSTDQHTARIKEKILGWIIVLDKSLINLYGMDKNSVQRRDYPMSIDLSGTDTKLESATVEIYVSQEHPLIRLANTLDWQKIAELVIEDIKKTTTKLRWWAGRKLKLRIHLAVFLLQSFLKMTDRGTEEAIRGNGIYQVFCGKTVVEKWHCPDHTKIEKFRNRLSPETQRNIISYVVQVAKQFGFADPSKMDVDSTVQEANMAYPSDAQLLTKLTLIGKKVIDYIKDQGREVCNSAKQISVNLKAVKKEAKAYFFMAKNVSSEIKHAAFEALYETVKEQIIPVIEICTSLDKELLKNIPWNIKRGLEQIQTHAKKYLDDIAYFIETQTMKSGKILSFHLKEVACIMKGKLGKAKEFGRVFQLGRIGGNFFIVLPSTTVRQEDKLSLPLIVEEHENIFGEGVLKSVGTDKGYYSKKNEKILQEKIPEVGIQIPGNVKEQRTIDQELKNRRAGIEPLIGHAKNFGLRKSRMKSDETTLASGYRSILGFNLHQLMRHQSILSAKI
jgi:hypothetical protein